MFLMKINKKNLQYSGLSVKIHNKKIIIIMKTYFIQHWINQQKNQ